MLFTVVEGEGVGAKALVVEGGETIGDGVPAAALEQFDELVRRGRNRLVEVGRREGVRRVVRAAAAAARLRRGRHGRGAAQGAKLLGWTAIVADARATFLTPERIPSADQLIPKWPEDAIADVAPDHQTAIVVLTHDDKFDEPALIAALETEAFYIGALGSRRNQERRRERLLEAGVARRSSPASWARAASTSAPTRRRRPRCRSSPRSWRCARSGRAGRCARRSSGSTRRWRSRLCVDRRRLQPGPCSRAPCLAAHGRQLERQQWPQHAPRAALRAASRRAATSTARGCRCAAGATAARPSPAARATTT